MKLARGTRGGRGARRLWCSQAAASVRQEGRTRGYSGLVWGAISIAFPTPLSPKGRIAGLSPRGGTGSGSGGILSEWKGWGRRRHVLQSGEPAALADVRSQLEASTLR